MTATAVDIEKEVVRLKVEEGLGRRMIHKRLGIGQRKIRNILERHGLGKQSPDAPPENHVVFLEEQVRHLTRENNRLRKGSALDDAVLDLFAQAKPIASRRVVPPVRTGQKAATREQLCIMLSDFHMGEDVDNEEVMGLNEYSTDIAIERVHNLIRGVKSVVSKMNGYHFEALNVFELGDMVSGIIHEELMQGTATVDQVLICARALADLTLELSELFPVVNVVGVIGNHGRLSKPVKFKRKWDNFDYLTYKIQEQICQAIPHANFHFPKSAMAMVTLYDWNFLLRHGDGKSMSFAGIPFYGISRTDAKLTQVLALKDRMPHYHCMGHYHTQNTLEKIGGKILMNGSLVGTSEYSWNAMFGAADAKQKLFSVHPEHGVTWEMDLTLA